MNSTRKIAGLNVVGVVPCKAVYQYSTRRDMQSRWKVDGKDMHNRCKIHANFMQNTHKRFMQNTHRWVLLPVKGKIFTTCILCSLPGLKRCKTSPLQLVSSHTGDGHGSVVAVPDPELVCVHRCPVIFGMTPSDCTQVWVHICI